MGCQVVTTEGYSLGKVIDMMETGSNDVLVIKANLKECIWHQGAVGSVPRWAGYQESRSHYAYYRSRLGSWFLNSSG